MDHVAESKKTTTFTDTLRIRFKGILDPIAAGLNSIGLMPNTLTILGLIGNTIGAALIAYGNITAGGIVILLMGPIDALDGTMARLRGESSNFGAFVDSVTDRYSELVIFLGLILHFLPQGNWINSSVVYLAAAGSVMVSYVRARAETLGFEAKVGLLTRLERYIVLVPSLVFNIPMVGLWIIAIMANITAVHRILYVRQQVSTKK